MKKSVTIILCCLFAFAALAGSGFTAGKYEISEQGRENAEFMRESALFYYYFQKKDLKNAVKYLETALEKRPRSESLLYWCFRLYDDGKFPENKFQEIARRHPEASLLCGTFAEALTKKGKHKAALELIENSFAYYLDSPDGKSEPRGKKLGKFPADQQLLLCTYLELIHIARTHQKGDALLEKIFRIYPMQDLKEKTLIDLIQYTFWSAAEQNRRTDRKDVEKYLSILKQAMAQPNEFHLIISREFQFYLISINEFKLLEQLLTESLLTNPVSPVSYSNLLSLFIVRQQNFNIVRALSKEIMFRTARERKLPKQRLAYLFFCALATEDPKLVAEHEKTVLSMGLLDDELRYKAAFFYLQNRNLEKAKFYCSKLKAGDSKDILTASILSEEKKYREAMQIFLKLERKFSDSTVYKMTVAELARKAGEKEIETQFVNEMRLKAEKYSDFQNYLGYTWAEDGINLDQAEKYLESALKSQPQNYAYLDSMAWIAYKKKDYQKARKFIKKALKLCGKDRSRGVLLDHAGDIFHALGEKRTALKYWQQAAQSGDLELDLDSVLKKLPALTFQPLAPQSTDEKK